MRSFSGQNDFLQMKELAFIIIIVVVAVVVVILMGTEGTKATFLSFTVLSSGCPRVLRALPQHLLPQGRARPQAPGSGGLGGSDSPSLSLTVASIL